MRKVSLVLSPYISSRGRHLGQEPERGKIPKPLADAFAEKMREVDFGVVQSYLLRLDVGGVGERFDEAAHLMDVLG